MKSQIALEFINKHIADGKTILIRTYTRITKITPKTVKNFEEAKAQMLDSRWANQVGNRAVRLSNAMKSGEWV